MFWPFNRKKPEPKPEPIDRRDWNEDWQVGDIAECIVEIGDWNETVKPWERPAKGDRLVVAGFDEGIDSGGKTLDYFLRFNGLPHGLSTRGFRKVRPIAYPEIVERILNAPVDPEKVREDA
jgi:hypothetical protein